MYRKPGLVGEAIKLIVEAHLAGEPTINQQVIVEQSISQKGQLEGLKRVPYALLNGSARLLLRAANGENAPREILVAGGRVPNYIVDLG